ncbi:MAG: TraB/GumN family protein [Sphingomicrobium sp.]
MASAPVAPSAPSASLLQPHPAMWVIRDEDTTVYLFGTFHALDGRSQWFEDGIRDAFSSADELVLETVIPEQPQVAVAAPSAMPRGFSVAPGASFLASTRMAISAGRDRGMQVNKGADMVLRRAAEAEGKAVEGLESFDFQLGMFNRMAPAAPVAATPVEEPGAKARLAAVMAQMEAAWSCGDQRIFTALLDDMRQATPDNYRAMFPERNVRWADWIVDRMEQPGTVFVAVGAGHFAGPDSVLSKLTLRGKVATRVN